MTTHRYTTDIEITVDGVTIECDAMVVFTHYAGLPDDPEPSCVELETIKVTLPGREPYDLGPPALINALDSAMQQEMFDYVEALIEEGRCDD